MFSVYLFFFLGEFEFIAKQEVVPDFVLHGIEKSIDVENRRWMFKEIKEKKVTSLCAGVF